MKLHNPYVKSIDKLDVTYIGMDMSAMNCRTCTVRGCNNYSELLCTKVHSFSTI